MNQQQIKRIRRMISKQEAKIKAKGLLEFVAFCNKHSFWGRLRIAYRILFKKIKV